MLIKSNIQKWGNSYAIKLPKEILEASGIKANSKVYIQSDGGSLTITLDKKQVVELYNLPANTAETKDQLDTANKSASSAIKFSDKTLKEIESILKGLRKNK